ncbi:hypothetical protein DPV78_003374 [Talaromyces pinophilus]|nr:hypothetical protein DPV78_003374 [Talaromyces pinophilus]
MLILANSDNANMLFLVMKFVNIAIYTNFRAHIINDEGIEQDDGFISGPKGGKLIVQFNAI